MALIGIYSNCGEKLLTIFNSSGQSFRQKLHNFSDPTQIAHESCKYPMIQSTLHPQRLSWPVEPPRHSPMSTEF
jgi:hypothetical protein